MSATVSPSKLTFFSGVGTPIPVQAQAVTVTGEDVGHRFRPNSWAFD
jgi:hypothetical protein